MTAILRGTLASLVLVLAGCGTAAGQRFVGTLVGADPPATPLSGPDVRIRQNGNPGFAGRDCLIAVSVNGYHITRIKAGEPLGIDVNPGTYTVAVEGTKDVHILSFPDSNGQLRDKRPARCAGWAASRQVSVNKTSRINLLVEPF